MSAVSPLELDVVRHRLLRRIDAARPRVIAANAPAGYGKSTVIRQHIRRANSPAICDCFGVRDAAELARRVAAALAVNDQERSTRIAQQHLAAGADWIGFALDSWSTASPHDAFVFENAEHVAGAVELVELLSRLLARTPPGRQLAICMRRSLPLSFARFFPPHEILTLHADDLRFDEAEIRLIFADAGANDRDLARVAKVTRGWPIAVFLLSRLARESDLPSVLDRTVDVNFADLYDYLSEQVLEAMPAARFNTLLAASALTSTTDDEVRAALGEAYEPLAPLARSSPFLYATAGDKYETHPLLRTMLLEKHPERCRSLRLGAATGLEQSNPLRAAQLFVECGEKTRAAQLLEGAHEFLMGDVPPLFAQVVAQLDVETLTRHPAVWQAATLPRLMGMPHEQWLREGLAVRERLTSSTPVSVRIGVLSSLANAMTNLGRHDEARLIFEGIAKEYPDLPQARAVVLGFCAMIDARKGSFTRALEQWNQAVPLFAGSSATQTLGIVQIEALVLRYRGDRVAERARLEAAIALAQDSGLPLGLTLAFEEAAFAAWFAGEDDLFFDCVRKLQTAMAPEIAGASEVFRRCAAGEPQALQSSRGIEHPKIRFYGALILCTLAGTGQAPAIAAAALDAANAAGEPMSAAMACIACAHFSPSKRGEFLKRAQAYASAVESLPLRRSIDAYVSNGEATGILAPFIKRLQHDTQARAAQVKPPCIVSLLRSCVEITGEVLTLTPRQLELVLYIAAHPGGCSREEISEALWPRSERFDTASLRVYVNRVRRRCKNAAIIVGERRRYRLGSDVGVDLLCIERTVAQARREPASLPDELRCELESHLERLMEFPRSDGNEWEWYAPVRIRIEDLTREIATILARASLSSGRIDDARNFARQLVDRDPCDEPARELLIRAYLASGDEPAAFREFRIYRDIVAEQLGASPSPSLRSLVADPEARKSAFGS